MFRKREINTDSENSSHQINSPDNDLGCFQDYTIDQWRLHQKLEVP